MNPVKPPSETTPTSEKLSLRKESVKNISSRTGVRAGEPTTCSPKSCSPKSEICPGKGYPSIIYCTAVTDI
jgi:hypothetical protein